MDFLIAAHTDVGIRKKTNQDSVLIKVADTDCGKVCFAAVCDGMGGLRKGELASATLIRDFSDWFDSEFPEILYVKPEEMNTVASNIENKISEWQAAVQKLYTLQQEMDAMWDGTANDSFNQNFQGDLQKFNALTNLMQEYVVAIKTAANNYISGEEEVKSIVTRK